MSPPSEIIDACAAYLEDHAQDHVATLVRDDGDRIDLSWSKLSRHDPDLADDLMDEPETVISGFRAGLQQADFGAKLNGVIDANIDRNAVDFAFYDFGEWKKPIRELRRDDVGSYVSVEAQVDMRTQVEPRVDVAAFECQRCGEILRQPQYGDDLMEPGECSCERDGPYTLYDPDTTYEDHQILEVSDPPELSTGRSDSLVVNAFNDLAGLVEAGDRVNVNGVLRTKSTVDETSPSRRRPIRMTAEYIETGATGFDDLSPQRIDEIKALGDSDDVYDKLVGSIAPHILTEEKGDSIKLALALQLFGGVERELATGFKRGNVNVLLIGSPGTAKSQYLGAVNKIAPRAVKVSGKGARPAGMTATAVQSEHTGEWTLKAGALVKASGGIACIDEFDKMQSETRSSMHEALEDQEISVAKADINTTLPAKCSVLAAANPEGGVLDRFTPLSEQISIGPTLISRFDLIFALRHDIDEARDREMARHQHDTADVGAPDPDPAIELELLTEYVAYARQNVFPSYASDDVRDDLVDFYVEMRQQAAGSEADNVRPVGPRVNELLRRLSQASARARLSESITIDDAERVKRLFKTTVGDVGLTEGGEVDGEKLRGGQGGPQRELRQVIMDSVRAREAEFDSGVPGDVLVDMVADEGFDRSRARDEINKMARSGDLYNPETGAYRAVD